MKSKVYIQPLDEGLDQFWNFIIKNNFNVEVVSFAYHKVLDDKKLCEAKIEQWKERLADFNGEASLHGAYLDLFPHSPDPRVAQVAEERIRQNLGIAEELRIKRVIFHDGYNKIIDSPTYAKSWVERNAVFWGKILSDFPDAIILMENVWCPDPRILAALIEKLSSDRFKICFDTGHFNVFAEKPLEEWLNKLHKQFIYIHANDNLGDRDTELIIGTGTFNWKVFSKLLEKHNLKPSYVFEVGSLEKVKKSIGFLEKKGFYPF